MLNVLAQALIISLSLLKIIKMIYLPINNISLMLIPRKYIPLFRVLAQN